MRELERRVEFWVLETWMYYGWKPKILLGRIHDAAILDYTNCSFCFTGLKQIAAYNVEFELSKSYNELHLKDFINIHASFSILKHFDISNEAPFVFILMVESVRNMALARAGRCCRSLVLQSSKEALCGVTQPVWTNGCAGGKTNKTR